MLLPLHCAAEFLQSSEDQASFYSAMMMEAFGYFQAKATYKLKKKKKKKRRKLAYFFITHLMCSDSVADISSSTQPLLEHLIQRHTVHY